MQIKMQRFTVGSTPRFFYLWETIKNALLSLLPVRVPEMIWYNVLNI